MMPPFERTPDPDSTPGRRWVPSGPDDMGGGVVMNGAEVTNTVERMGEPRRAVAAPIVSSRVTGAVVS